MKGHVNKSSEIAKFNIGRKECRKRLVTSIGSAFLTVVMFIAMRWGAFRRPWYLLLFVPAFIAVLGLFQARARTCVVLAARGLRNLDQGEEKIDDKITVQLLRRRAVIIYLKALALALAFTALVYWTS